MEELLRKYESMKLEDLGYHEALGKYRLDQHLVSHAIGRIISEHKERYIIKTVDQELEAEVIGHMRFSAQTRHDFPAVGDWVAFSAYDDRKALIHAIYPRKTIIERQAPGKTGEKQIIATNVDYGFIVQAVDRDFNINRIERYVTICKTSGVEPLIILNKIDLVTRKELNSILQSLVQRTKDIKVIPISNETRNGYEILTQFLTQGVTCCLLGSSGVGKSTLVNHLIGAKKMETGEISSSTRKGRHITSHRELFILQDGGIIIDNPGMREVGIADAGIGLQQTFDQISILSRECKFGDCTHTHEKGCAIKQAVDNGDLDGNAYQNYLKMQREEAHFETSIAEKRKKDKGFGKMVKEVKRFKKNTKY